MTQRTKAGLQANFNADLPDNSTGEISAADVRDNLIDFSDSVPFLSSATNVVSGSFSGSFQGDGSGITGVTGEWDGSLNGNASITGSLVVTSTTTTTNATVDGTLAVTSGGRGIFKNLNDGIYLGTYDLTSEGAYPGYIIRSTAAASGSQIVGYKYGSYLPIYLNADGASRGKVFIGYSGTETNSDISAQLNLKDTNGTYALDTTGGASFRNGTTRFESANLNFVETYIALDSSSAYPFRPVNDATGEGLAIGRYSNPTNQQLIMSYQGGAGRVIAKELTANAPQLRLELDDNLATTELFRGQKTLITLFKNTLVSGSLTTTGGASGSFSGSFRGDGSGLTGISGGSADTGSLLTTASVNLNTITFTKGDASTFNITVDTGSAGGSISYPLTPPSNVFYASAVPPADAANIGFAIARPSNETSQQLILSYQGGAGRVIAKETNAAAPQMRFELYNGSSTAESLRLIQNKTFLYTPVSIENNLGVTGNATITGSLTTTGGASGSFSGSFRGDGSGLTGISGGSTDTGSLLITASVSSNTITFTKGDASTFNITVDTGSAGGSTFPYSGSAVITGSLNITTPPGIQDPARIFTVDGTNSRIELYAANINVTSSNYILQSRKYFGAGNPGDITVRNSNVGFGQGDTIIDAGNLYLTGSTINSTGSWTHANDLTVQGTLTATIDSANTASVVQITADNANTNRYVLFSATNTDAESPLADTSLRYNPSTNTLIADVLQGTATTATTASHALTALTASYALTAPASDPFPYTGSAGITGSLDVVGDFTVDKSGDSYLNTGSILAGNLELLGNASALMRGRVNTEIRGESLYDASPALPGNITIANTLVFGSTKGYTKIDAGDVFISGSAVYIKPSSLPTSEPSDSGQLWLSGSAGNSKYLMVRD